MLLQLMHPVEPGHVVHIWVGNDEPEDVLILTYVCAVIGKWKPEQSRSASNSNG